MSVTLDISKLANNSAACGVVSKVNHNPFSGSGGVCVTKTGDIYFTKCTGGEETAKLEYRLKSGIKKVSIMSKFLGETGGVQYYVATDTITDPKKRMWAPIGEPVFFHNSFEWGMFLNPGNGTATDTAVFTNTVVFSAYDAVSQPSSALQKCGWCKYLLCFAGPNTCSAVVAGELSDAFNGSPIANQAIKYLFPIPGINPTLTPVTPLGSTVKHVVKLLAPDDRYNKYIDFLMPETAPGVAESELLTRKITEVITNNEKKNYIKYYPEYITMDEVYKDATNLIDSLRAHFNTATQNFSGDDFQQSLFAQLERMVTSANGFHPLEIPDSLNLVDKMKRSSFNAELYLADIIVSRVRGDRYTRRYQPDDYKLSF